jgi:hypothetical protein
LNQRERQIVEGGELIADGGVFESDSSVHNAQSNEEGAALSTIFVDVSYAVQGASDITGARKILINQHAAAAA